MNDRIRLAEAMFPDYAFANNTNGEPLMCHNDDWSDDSRIRNVPDPFHDANDDYAVLEWMRTNHGRSDGIQDNLPWFRFRDFLKRRVGQYASGYQIGDYARAALKVIE